MNKIFWHPSLRYGVAVRPKKNRAEQKNWTHVRQFLGYERLDQETDLTFLNDLYYWLILWNYFTPVMKLKSKTPVGRRVVRVYDEPQTPCDRLLKSGHLSQEEKQRLVDGIDGVNPFHLRAELNQKLKWYFKIVSARPKSALFAPDPPDSLIASRVEPKIADVPRIVEPLVIR